LCSVDSIGDDEACNHIVALALHGFIANSFAQSSVREPKTADIQDIPAAMKGAIGFTVVNCQLRQAQKGHDSVAARAGQSIDVHTGAGNFLRGMTPNQDILTVSVGDEIGEEFG
jgi:hypothetical protein